MKLGVRRILLPVGLAATMAVAAGAPAAAQGQGAQVHHCRDIPGQTGGNTLMTPSGNLNHHCRTAEDEGPQGEGAVVHRCSDAHPALKGNSVITPSGHANYHCRSTL